MIPLKHAGTIDEAESRSRRLHEAGDVTSSISFSFQGTDAVRTLVIAMGRVGIDITPPLL